MKEVTDIWFKTNLELEKLAAKLCLDVEEYDHENVWEWIITPFEDIKIDICRDHTEKRSQTFTMIFRIDEHKKLFPEKLLNQFVSNLQNIGIAPIYLGKSWIGKNDNFECEIARIIK